MTDDQEHDWQPIETAPKEGGKKIIVSNMKWESEGHWNALMKSWMTVDNLHRLQGVTHWRPLPKSSDD